MTEEDDIAKQKIQEKIAEKLSKLNQSSAKAYREQLKALNNNNSALETFQNLLEDINTRIEDQSQGFAGLLTQIKKINEELGSENKFVNDATKAFRGLESIASRLKDDQKGYTDLNIKQLKQEKSKLKSLEDQAKEAAKQIAIDKGIVDLAHVNLAFRHDLSEEQRAILTAAQENFSVYKRTNELLEERIKEEKKVNRTLGLTKVALEGLGKIPIVGPLLDTNEALDAARAKAKAGGNAISSMSAAMGSMGKSLLSSLADPLVMIGLLVKGFQTFLELGFAVDKQVTDLSKSMAVSSEEATATRDRFKQIAEEVATSANQSERLVINQYSLTEAQLELAKAFGVTRGFTDQQLKDQVILTKLMGLTGEESKGIQQLAIANGMKVREVTGSIIKQTSALVKQTGIQLDNKEILQDVAKVSGQLRLQYANNPDLISKAVIQAKLLGISLETAANAAKGLLQFEDSIENELSAELLTGKALNLERARGLALNGKSIEAAAEMLSQVGSAADFANMNVIQQEAIAKAIGMSADELANSLVAQENIANLSANTREQVEQALKKAVTEEEKQRILAKLGNEEDAKAALEKLNAQETLNNALDQMKKLLGAIFEGPAKGFVNLIAELAGDMPRLMGYFYKLKSILVSLAEFSLAKMAFNVASSAAATLGPVAGVLAGVGAYAWGRSLMPSFEDGGVVSGPTIGLMGEYPGAKSNPEVIAPLDKLKKIIRDDKGNNNQNSPSLITAINNLASRPIHVSVGKTGTEKYNEMISTSSPTMLNEGGKVSINPNKNTMFNEGGKVSINPNKNTGTNSSNNQYSPAMLAAINELNSNVIALASRPILVSTQIDNKELILSSLKLPEIRGIVNTSDTYAMGSGPNPNTPI
jgi:hypothetical protein